MRKALIYIGTVILSLLIVFVVFEALSLYHFGDIPTKIVLIRLIACFLVIEGIELSVIALVKRNRK